MRTTEKERLGFHVSRPARDRYRFDRSLFVPRGNTCLPDVYTARSFAQKMNEKRDLVRFPEQAVKAGQLNAVALIVEIMHHVAEIYRDQVNPALLQQALDWLNQDLGPGQVDLTLGGFADEFPPLAVYERQATVDEYLLGREDSIPHRQILLEELLMLWLANENPAFAPLQELFEDDGLIEKTGYSQIVSSLHEFLDTQPPFGPGEQNLIDMLRGPAIAAPHSLSGQLEYIRNRWGAMLGRYLVRLLGSLDLIREDEKTAFLGPGPALVYEFDELGFEPERFSPDRDWMPRLVLVAKNAYVWLDQLSKKHQRPITHLDQVPDEELDLLARRGFSGLWLIGLWERSVASQQVKQMCGNPEAVASAYSLYDYVIAADLGGEPAFQDLKARAWQRGIRLASDMVPNHVGIYSRWVVEHPDWFVSLDHSPFPNYSFNGPDLSQDERVGIYLEDHYYDRSDAAVVFKRVDRWAGSERYIYHGNDGTSMPWNDTAQLNYLNPAVREAVIQTILHVARQFPVIRFDAAMTLTKKHFQRLWFPEPGTGGAIPTRAEHGLSRAAFDAAMPNEFWREVVDRVAAEVPDTLLLAEAFWLLEGYFVRTLGMHRVYNSAFMNMLRDEDNANYRQVVKNTLEFDPEILKRFVNFMNNPDEETAVAQFGKGDKYFGICTMMATMPGLPMFGHGQVEGFSEKYGMEYQRAYWDEHPDETLMRQHEREIFSLLHRRHLFAQVRDFLLYDFFAPEGHVNEDVFAYSNRAGDERSLVVYHNKYATAQGWIRTSVAVSVKTGEGDDRTLVQKSLGEGLGLPDDAQCFCVFRDHVAGLEYIRHSQELCRQGLYVELDAYKRHVFLDWREVWDDEQGQYARLNAHLNGRGVPSIQEALREMLLQPVLHPFRELVGAGAIRWLVNGRVTEPDHQLDAGLLDDVEQRTMRLLQGIRQFAAFPGDAATDAAIAQETRQRLAASLQLPVLGDRFPGTRLPGYSSAVDLVQGHLNGDLWAWGTLLGWLFTHNLGRVAGEAGAAQSRSGLDEWLLGRVVTCALQDLGLGEDAAWRAVAVVKILVTHQHWFETLGKGVVERWFRDDDVRGFLQVNRHQDVLWFNKEAFEQLLRWMLTVAVVQISADPHHPAREVSWDITACYNTVRELQQAAEEAAYQVAQLCEIVGDL